jgi:hypothetical protein
VVVAGLQAAIETVTVGDLVVAGELVLQVHLQGLEELATRHQLLLLREIMGEIQAHTPLLLLIEVVEAEVAVEPVKLV